MVVRIMSDYRQKHPETCLAKCLMILVEKEQGKELPDSYELEILNYSFKHDRESISRGHLEKIAKDFGLNLNWIVDTKIFYDFTMQKSLPKKVNLTLEKINLKLIDSLLSKPLILYVDRFYLWKEEFGLYYKYHYPHFIIVSKRVGDKYEIIDPDDGLVRLIEKQKLSKAIISLKNHLWFSPQVIQLR
jgi:ABC-type bacteriocin/lantibiotic exporter with double-glycine peptidase domain